MRFFIGLVDGLTYLLYLFLSPLLILQAAHARTRVILLPEPPGPREGQAGNGEPFSLLVVGDSAGAGVGAAVQSQGLLGRLLGGLTHQTVNWKLWASTGNTTDDALEHLREQDAELFDLVVVSLGVNDVTELVPVLKWIEKQQRLVEFLRNKFGARRIVLAGLPPMSKFPLLPQPLRFCLGLRAKLFTRVLKWHFRDEPNLDIIVLDRPFSQDMMAMDGFHPGPLVYEIWADEIVGLL